MMPMVQTAHVVAAFWLAFIAAFACRLKGAPVAAAITIGAAVGILAYVAIFFVATEGPW